jgi:hypothetical protein
MNMELYGPISAESKYYIRRSLEDRILESLQTGNYVNLRGGRQTGKTSTVFSLRIRLDIKKWAHSYVDLSAIFEPNFDMASYFRSLSNSIYNSLEPKLENSNVLPTPEDVASFREFIYSLARAIPENARLVVFLDEITAVPDQLQQALFSTFRAMFNHSRDPKAPREIRNVLFVFSGTFDHQKLIRGYNSPFNIADDFDTTTHDFSREEVSLLLQEMGIGDYLEPIYQLTSGHPYLTNRIILELFAQGDIDIASQKIVLNDTNLSTVGGVLLNSEDGVIRLAERLHKRESLPFSLGISKYLDCLIINGIVKSDSTGQTVVRCALYEKYLERLFRMRTDQAQFQAVISPVDFLAPGMLRAHAATLLGLAPEVASESPALAAICVGIVLETVLLMELEGRSDLTPHIIAFNAGQNTNRRIDNPNNPQVKKWKLFQMIEIAKRCGLITSNTSQISHVLRDWRNLVHPAELRDEFPNGIASELATAAIGVSHLLLRELRDKHP